MRPRLQRFGKAMFFAVLVGANGASLAMPLPDGSGALNVRAFGARGDGRSDDTAAILAAIAAARVEPKLTIWPARVVYFPPGTYLVSKTLENRTPQGSYLDSLSLVGASATTSRVKLIDSSAGFESKRRPKAVVYTSSRLLAGAATDGGKDYVHLGEGNDAYGNFVEDLTIDVGENNPGAVGIDFIANNVGAVRRVHLTAGRNSGATAIAMERKWPGPLLVSDVRIDGFDVGISIGQPEYHVTLQDITWHGQSVVALRNDGNSVSLHGGVISGPALPVQNVGVDGLLVVDGLSVVTDDTSSAWIDNRGYVVVKSVHRKSASKQAKPDSLQSGADGAYLAAERLSKFGASWSLPRSRAPRPQDAPFNRWANVVDFGAVGDGTRDSAGAIQAALRSGASVVLFPTGRYRIDAPLDVPATVRRIVGMRSFFVIGEVRRDGWGIGTGMFRVMTSGEPLVIEGLALDHTNRGSQVGVEHGGTRSLVLEDVFTFGTDVVRTVTGGPLFIEDVCCGNFHFSGRQSIQGSQLNTEGGALRIENDGAPLSILGLKVEGASTAIASTNGARSEVLGGLIYQVRPVERQVPAFVNDAGSTAFLAYAEEAYIRGSALYRAHPAERTR